MSILAEVSLTPIDKGESVGKYVARTLEVIEESGIDYRLGAMGTCLEGEWDEVMAVVKDCFEKMREDSHRISITLKIDYRAGRTNRLQGKVESVEKYLGHPLKK